MQENIIKIIFGIRYRRSFRIPDIAGEIVDSVLNDETSPFSTKFFSQIGDVNNGKVLLNQDGDMLSVDFDNIVLTLNVKKENFSHILKTLRTEYYPFLAEITKKFNIGNFNRVGVIFEHQITHGDLISKIVCDLTDSKIERPDNLELRFSKKLAKNDTAWQKDVVDYHNIIATYFKNIDGLNIKLDYQTYFSPEISLIDDVEIEKFIESARNYLEKNFYGWHSLYEKE